MLEQPESWNEAVDLLEVARVMLGEEPKKDTRPWVRGCEPVRLSFNKAVSQASSCKRAAASCEDWQEADYEVRRCVASEDGRRGYAESVQDKVDHVFLSVCHLLRSCGSSLVLEEVQPAEAQREREWTNIPSHSPMAVVWGAASSAPNEQHAAL